MRKHCKRRHYAKAAPTMVAYLLNPEVSTQERMAVVAFRSGWAGASQFNVLADCRDMLALAAAERDDRQTLAVCELALVALENVKTRYREKARFGASGDELQALQVLVDVSEDFWRRQPGSLFISAEAALSKAREMARGAA